MTQHLIMGGLQPYNELEYGWALNIGYQFASYEYQAERLRSGKANESDTIRRCNDIINSLNRSLFHIGIKGRLPLYDHADGYGQTIHQHRSLIDLLWRERSTSHAVYYLIGTAIGERHHGFNLHAVRERIRQIEAWFPGVLDTVGRAETLFNLTEADCDQPVLPKEPLAAKALLRAMFEPRVILFVSTDPVHSTGTLHLHSSREHREITQALASSKFGSGFVIEPMLSCRSRDLVSKIQGTKPAYIHFSGHGNIFGLMFEDENNNPMIVDHNPLAYLLKVVQKEAQFRLKGAFLNACYSAENGQILANSTGALVAIQSSVTDENAITFATRFYKALGDGSPFESSFNRTIAELGILSGIARNLKPCFFTAK
ncbi:hypothetical protein BDV97DRAFT_106373 [Delphinella strobiligena]|nr:hypothetical protein BDV97DRAFT_106373 [Delphinella strobiligena]